MTITVEDLYQQALQLSLAERQRLAALLVAPEAPAAGAPISPLGQHLRILRAEIERSGAPLLDRAALEAELAERRGER